MLRIPKQHEEFSGPQFSTPSLALEAPPCGGRKALDFAMETSFPCGESRALEEEKEEDMEAEDVTSMISKAPISGLKVSDQEDSLDPPPDSPPSTLPACFG